MNKGIYYWAGTNKYFNISVTPGIVLVKKSKIFFSLFLSLIGLEIIFSDVLGTKQGFHNKKNINFVKSKKMGIFQRG